MSAFLPLYLAIGEQIELELSLSSTSQPLRVRAAARNRRSFAASPTGLQFLNLTRAQYATRLTFSGCDGEHPASNSR